MGRIAGPDVREKHRLGFGVIQFSSWRNIELNDAQELSEGRFNNEVLW